MGIKIRGDPVAKTLTIEDTGIGMTRDDLVSSLGTIARSGTAKFMELLNSQAEGENLIGKFGVGFYSAFLVADKITVVTKNVDDEAWIWESEINQSSYSIREAGDEAEGWRGTRIVLTLKEAPRVCRVVSHQPDQDLLRVHLLPHRGFREEAGAQAGAGRRGHRPEDGGVHQA